jgi:hypothetical protein
MSEAINRFGDRHHVTGRSHFAQLLGYKGDNAAIQLSGALNHTSYNPALPKAINVDQLIVMLDELGEDRKVIFDALAKEYGGVFHFNAEAAPNHDNVRDELIEISHLAGELSGKFLKFKHNDGVIDDLEAQELEKIAYETRKQLRAFEEMIKHYTKSSEE